ncbi:MAG: hypothetical protein M3Y41_02770 [Pseudomonadota bacterium]|nr:hypothetical protein [Pseudomonadota bacterium]
MAAFPQFTRPPQKLAASGIVGATSPDEWRALHAVPVAWDELFTSTGLFGIEIGPAAALSGTVVQLNGFMTPPATADADYFVLSRSPLPNCPFCVPAASWPDDVVVVHLRAPGVDIDHPMQAITAAGVLELGELAGPLPNLVSHVRLRSSAWTLLA